MSGGAAPLHGGLIGFGVIASGHLEGYRQTDRMQVDFVVDECAARRDAAKAFLPGVRTYSTLDEALHHELPDFLDICTPPASHLDLAVQGLELGLLVLCEKPLVLDGSQLHKLVEAADASSGTLHPCHNYLFAPAIRALSQEVRRIGGPVVGGEFTTIRPGHARGVSSWDPDWRRRPEISGGGILRDHGPHSIYIAESMVGRRVTGVACTVEHPPAGPWQSTEDIATMELHFDDTIVRVQLRWRGAARQTTYRLDLDGTSVQLADDRLVTTSRAETRSTSHHSEFNDPRHGSWFAALLSEAYDAHSEGVAHSSLLDSALATVATLDAAYQSAARDGTIVLVPDLASARG